MFANIHSRSKWFWFLVFALLTFAVYAPSWKAGFFLDFSDTLALYKEQSFREYINRAGINNKSLYQVTQFLLYFFISVFGHHPIPWFFLFLSLHAINGLIIYRFFSRFFAILKYENGKGTALAGTLLFLCNPVQAEVLIWKAAFHYLTAILIIFSILSWILSYIETENKKFLWRIYFLYFISIFTLELFYLTPVFSAILLLAIWFTKNMDRRMLLKCSIRIWVPLLLIWLVHFITYILVYHKLVAHYDIVPNEFGFLKSVGKINKYVIHVYFMEYFLRQDIRNIIYHFADSIPAVITTLVFLLLVLFAALKSFRKWNPSSQVLFILCMLSLCSFMLVVPLWFNNMLLMRNDRYYYLPSVFMLMLLAALIFKIKKKNLRLSLLISYVILCMAGTASISWKARYSAKIFYGLLDRYQWQDAPLVLLLNLPNNYQGIGMIPAQPQGYFKDQLKVFKGLDVKGEVYDVSSYNMQAFWNGAHVVVEDSARIKVTLNQWGTWWWYLSFGAVSYENEVYKVDMTDPGHEYILTLKNPSDSIIMLYQQGDQWRVVDRNKKGSEQW